MRVIAAARCDLNIDDRPWADLESELGSRPSRVRIPHPPPTPKQPLTCGTPFRSDRPGTASHQTSRRPVSIPVSVSGRRLLEVNLALRCPPQRSTCDTRSHG